MNVKQPSRRGLTMWFVTMALVLGGTLSDRAALNAGANRQDAAAQDQDRKDEKKDEKKGLPLKSDRKVEFTTDEGTWLSLDVSPDGKTTAFAVGKERDPLAVRGKLRLAVERHSGGAQLCLPAFDSERVDISDEFERNCVSVRR